MARMLKIGEPCICDCCKHPKLAAVISISHGHRKALCEDCAKISGYDSLPRNAEDVKHSENVDSWRVGLEIEVSAYPVDSQATMDKMHASASTPFWHCKPEHDVSLDDQKQGQDIHGIEYHYDIANLCGVKSALTTIYNIYGDCLTDRHSGQHINVSYADMTSTDFETIKLNNKRIFSPLIDAMKQNRDLTEKVFGRYFTYYASDTFSNDHYDGFSIRENRIEYRVSKFQSVNQYVQLINLCLDMTKCIRNNYCKNNYDVYKLDITANKLVKLFYKYANGEAQCQKAERNSK